MIDWGFLWTSSVFFSQRALATILFLSSFVIAGGAYARCPALPFDRSAIDEVAGIRLLSSSFTRIAAGTVSMGAPQSVRDQQSEHERYWQLQHSVTVSEPFDIQNALMTQEQFVRLRGYNPSGSKYAENCPAEHTRIGSIELCPSLPVDGIELLYAQGLVKRLNKIQKTYKYSLPTDAQWELAAKGPTGPTETLCSNPNGLAQISEKLQFASNGIYPTLVSEETLLGYPDPERDKVGFVVRGFLTSTSMLACASRGPEGAARDNPYKIGIRSRCVTSNAGLRLVRTLK